MKKYMTKPVLAVIAAATVAGGLTPVLANADTLRQLTGSKVVMNDETKQEVTRYQLKDLVENDPATLNLLLKTQAEHLYLVVDAIDLDVKMSTYIAEHETEWNKIYKEHYANIYLEVRYDVQEDGFVKVTPETKEDKTYIKGKVTDDVTKIVVTTPNGDTIEVLPNSDDTFAVSFAAATGSTAQYATLKAYVDGKLVETKKVRVNPGTVMEKDTIIHTLGMYNSAKKEVKVTGMVRLNADKIYVTHGGVKKAVDVKKVWDGVGSYTVTFKDVNSTDKEALVEAYKDDKKIDSEKVSLVGTWEKPDTKPTPASFTITGTATISPKYKAVIVKGAIKGSKLDGNYKLYLIGPDGNKQEVKLEKDGQFELNISFKNRSFSSKFVHLELYKDEKLVAQTNINHGIPNNHITIDDDQWKGKYKDKDKDKGKGHGKNGHNDDDDHDDDDHDDDDHGDDDDDHNDDD